MKLPGENEKNIITLIGANDMQTLTTASEKIIFSTTSVTKSETSLSAVSDGVKIGKNIKKVLVSGLISFAWNSPKEANLLPLIKRNNVEIFKVDGSKPVENYSVSIAITPFLVNVEEGDVISLAVYFSAANALVHGSRTYLTVEVVE